MKTNTRLLFKFLLRQCDIDCIFDVGSCDGYESCLFRQVRPEASIVAFEANPILYKKMSDNPNLRENRIQVFPFAISNKNGTAQFYVREMDYDDVDYANPDKNPGNSSLLAHDYWKYQTVEAQTRRVDEFLLSQYPAARNVALWIDVEGAEFEVLEGIVGIKDRVVALHVETARVPMRKGQKTYAELEPLVKSLGFVPIGTDMHRTSDWGDVVFIRNDVQARLGFRYRICQLGGGLSYYCHVHWIGSVLKKHCNPLYRALSHLYLKLFG